MDVERLDQMLDLVGEIAVSRGRLRQLSPTRAQLESEKALEVHHEADRLETDLQELVTRIRMIPIGPTLHQFAPHGARSRAPAGQAGPALPRGRRDRARHARDREDPRSPHAHGAQRSRPRDRGARGPRAGGQDPWGTVRLRAFHDTGSIVIELADDGKGIDRRLLVERARAKGSSARRSDARRTPRSTGSSSRPASRRRLRSRSFRAAASGWTSSSATSRRFAARSRSRARRGAARRSGSASPSRSRSSTASS